MPPIGRFLLDATTFTIQTEFTGLRNWVRTQLMREAVN